MTLSIRGEGSFRAGWGWALFILILIILFVIASLIVNNIGDPYL